MRSRSADKSINLIDIAIKEYMNIVKRALLRTIVSIRESLTIIDIKTYNIL